MSEHGMRRSPQSRESGSVAARRAGAQDRDERHYARKRYQQARQRAELERRTFDPAPPGDEDWTIGEDGTDALRRLTPPQSVAETLEALVRRRGWQGPLRTTALWSRWGEIVGDDLARRCEPVRLSHGVLTVRTVSQPWAVQLKYLVSQLKDQANAVLGARTVTDVTIVVGPLQSTTDGEPG